LVLADHNRILADGARVARYWGACLESTRLGSRRRNEQQHDHDGPCDCDGAADCSKCERVCDSQTGTGEAKVFVAGKEWNLEHRKADRVPESLHGRERP
jgi:hypothetical protein